MMATKAKPTDNTVSPHLLQIESKWKYWPPMHSPHLFPVYPMEHEVNKSIPVLLHAPGGMHWYIESESSGLLQNPEKTRGIVLFRAHWVPSMKHDLQVWLSHGDPYNSSGQTQLYFELDAGLMVNEFWGQDWQKEDPRCVENVFKGQCEQCVIPWELE
jgi:hypothetical protein